MKATVGRSPADNYIHYFILPDGSHVRWRLCNHKTKDIHCVKSTKIPPSLFSDVKKNNPILSLWSNHSVSTLICADFDSVPEGMASFDELYKYLTDKYPGAVTTRSFRNKVKTLFLIKNDTDPQWLGRKFDKDPKLASDTLDFILQEPRLISSVDHSKGGLNKFFLTEFIQRDIHSKLPQLKSVLLSSIKILEPTSIPTDSISATYSYIETTEELPTEIVEYTDNLHGKMQDKMTRLFQHLIPIESLRTTFDLPLSILANCMGIKSKRQAKRYRDKLEEDGWLEKTTDYTRTKGQGYKATSKLLKYIKRNKPKLRSIDSAPKSISDGKWDTTLFEQAHIFFPRKKHYVDWYQTLPGIHLKDRLDKAEATYKRVEEYRSRGLN